MEEINEKTNPDPMEVPVKRWSFYLVAFLAFGSL